MLEEIRELGFFRAELSHGVPASLVPGILKAVGEKMIAISSVHNFCPLPSMVRGAAPNLFQPSAKKGIEKRAWLRHSQHTLEFAASVGATHVVMHSGSLNFGRFSPAPDPKAFDSSSGPDREKALRKIQRHTRRTLPRVERSYRELLPVATELGIFLAIENREGFLELPADSDLPEFLSRFENENICHWHDTGHAEIKRRLGLGDPAKMLEEVADRLAGFHLHDVDGEGRDHRPIGSGSIDFRALAQFFRPHHHLVLELNPRMAAEEIIRSREHLLSQMV